MPTNTPSQMPSLSLFTMAVSCLDTIVSSSLSFSFYLQGMGHRLLTGSLLKNALSAAHIDLAIKWKKLP